MEKYLYLGIMIFTVCFTFPYSFDKKIYFIGSWKFVFPAIFSAFLILIPWDVYFTSRGFWGFNPNYILGYKIFLLPIEEWLFFICAPFSCLFIYEALKYYFKTDLLQPYAKSISLVLIGFSIVMIFCFYTLSYTALTFAMLLLLLLFNVFVIKSPHMGRFYFAYLFALLPFFLVNSALTGSWIPQEVVWYNNAENLGIRIGTVPVEDLFYNMFMLFFVFTVYEELKAKFSIRKFNAK
jgi:lycopene cyclase domain-containing protein